MTEKDIKLINFYHSHYKSMVFEIFHKLIIQTKKNNILIDRKKFFFQNIEIQIKIIEIIYCFLMGNKKNLRYSKTTKTLENLQKREEIRVNLSGMNIIKSNILMSFSLQKN